MSVSSKNEGNSEDEAGQIIEKYGNAAVSYIVQLIEDAVREGDDARVDTLDRLLREIERRLAATH